MKLLDFLGRLFTRIKYYWRDRKIKKLNQDLEKILVDQENERKEFLHEFRFYLRKYLRRDASGKYIPLKGKNKAEIYENIMHVHGKRLQELNIKFSKDLRISL